MKSYLLPVAILLFLASCAPDLRFHHKVDQMVADGDYQGAYALVEENREEYTENSAALFYADTGTLAHYAGRPEESIEMLLQAEKIIEELYTTSISKEATTFIINDTMAPYKGEDFENVMLNLFLALDYLEIGEIDEALVEARKVDSKLNLINSSYPPDKILICYYEDTLDCCRKDQTSISCRRYQRLHKAVEEVWGCRDCGGERCAGKI